MDLDSYINCLLVGVPLVLLATRWREAWDVLDRAFNGVGAEPREMPLVAQPRLDDELA